jgi:predicted glycogen debranching enzyme
VKVNRKWLEALCEKEIEKRVPRNNFFHCLVDAAHQFHIHADNGDRYILAGYPWFKCRARDTFIALPGLTLSIEEYDYFELIMKTAGTALEEFMKHQPITKKIYEIDKPDVPLWCVWAIQQYAKEAGKEKCVKMYGKLLDDILKFIVNDQHPNMQLRDNGLLFTEGKDEAMTWMNSTANGRPVVPRTGYIVEFNALWYNALCFGFELADSTGDQAFAEKLRLKAEQVKASFLKTFVNKWGYLFDFVDEETPDWSVRPNMIFAAALDYSPLSKEQKRMYWITVPANC